MAHFLVGVTVQYAVAKKNSEAFEMLRMPHYLAVDNRLTDGRKVVSPTHRPHFTLEKHYYNLLFICLFLVLVSATG
jgi:hypothetical protein